MKRFQLLMVVVVTLCGCCNEGGTDRDLQGAKPLILVTGATGRQGGAVAPELLDRGYQVRGLTRNIQSPSAQALVQLGVEMVKGDYDDAASLDRALDGAYGMFGVTSFWEHGYEQEIQHGKNLIDAALRSNVQHFVFSSVASANQDTGIPHFDSKWEIEQYLRASTIRYTVVRPVSFMENWSLDDEELLAGEIVSAGALNKAHQYISVRDIGLFVGEAFDNPEEWNGASIDVAGDELSLVELCTLLTDSTKREIVPRKITWKEHEERFGEEMTMMSQWFDGTGYSVDIAELRREYPDLMTMREYFSELSNRTSR